MLKKCFDCVRKTNPLVHNITHYALKNTFTAIVSAVSACGVGCLI